MSRSGTASGACPSATAGTSSCAAATTVRSGDTFPSWSRRSLDAVVGGFRLLADRPLPSSLLLGLFDDAGTLQHIGIASSFSKRLRHELLEVLGELTVPLAGHPWERGFLLEGSPVGRLKG